MNNREKKLPVPPDFLARVIAIAIAIELSARETKGETERTETYTIADATSTGVMLPAPLKLSETFLGQLGAAVEALSSPPISEALTVEDLVEFIFIQGVGAVVAACKRAEIDPTKTNTVPEEEVQHEFM
jgi:hypothetical protein